ncbi:MAG: hypothetical protein GVY35_08410 [Bacteroidetes bacterium]|jgi:hypothetical protein|nr:hypothetical protein [Bacteroidota bacterium]
MSEQSEYLTTVKELMRLTRNGQIQWREKEPVHKNALPSFEGKYNGLLFRLEDAISPYSVADYAGGLSDFSSIFDVRYRLIIKDQTDEEQPIISPPMKAVTDLVFVIQGTPDKKKLKDINKRLAES